MFSVWRLKRVFPDREVFSRVSLTVNQAKQIFGFRNDYRYRFIITNAL